MRNWTRSEKILQTRNSSCKGKITGREGQNACDRRTEEGIEKLRQEQTQLADAGRK